MSFPPLLSDNKIFLKQNKNVEESYNQFLSELREDISDGEESPYLSIDFQDELSKIIFEKDLDQYSPLRFYWLNLIDKIIDTIALQEEEFESSNELVGVFSESDLLGFVVKLIEDGSDTEEILDQVIDYQELQIISFYHLHISSKNWQPNGPVLYPMTPEIGETNGMLYLGEDKRRYYLPQYKDETVVPIIGHIPSEDVLQVMLGEDILNIKSLQNDETILKVKNLTILPGINSSGHFNQEHFEKVSKALETISELTPNLSEVLSRYTHTIVPIFEEELVSYSMAILPGFSSINMANRDFVDMVDDLLHENGHHFLNCLLEGEEEIIYEDDDKIFYSPWRRSLRPIRGLYHGVVTFYWAYRLFKELSFNEKTPAIFTELEVEKINFRFIEESILIKRCFPEIQRAFDLDKVSDYGLKIIDVIESELNENHSLEQTIFNKLTSESQDKINKIKEEIKVKM